MNGKTIQSRKVFLSSTTSDLGPYRTVAHKVIDTLNAEFNGQYSLTGTSMISETQDGERQTAVEVSRAWVAEADWVVLIVAWNYGYVQDGEPCSVTEWEYRQAVEVSKPAKKCFVFMAGEERDGEFEYRALDKAREPVNLMSFKGTSNHPDKLVAFKNSLRGGRFTLFSDIEHFREIVTQTLRRKIQKDLTGGDGEDIAAVLLFTGLLTPVRDCIASVKTLAALKRLHDRLHKIRQFGIRRWREEVLMLWQGDDQIPVLARLSYAEGLVQVNDMIGEIRGLFGSLGPDLQTTLSSIQRVLDHFKLNGGQMSARRQDFEQSTDRFASRVQAAFTACDWQMRLVSTQLGARHQQLVAKGKVAQNSMRLKPAERDLLREEIDQTQSLHERLQHVLEQHNAWQRVHDSLQVVDDNRHRESFEMAIAPVIDARAEMSDLAGMAATLVDDDARRATLSLLIDKVRRNLDLLAAEGGEPAYDAMRKAFDDLFFQVDGETLIAVEDSEKRSTLLERSLLEKEREFEELGAKAAERRLGSN